MKESVKRVWENVREWREGRESVCEWERERERERAHLSVVGDVGEEEPGVSVWGGGVCAEEDVCGHRTAHRGGDEVEVWGMRERRWEREREWEDEKMNVDVRTWGWERERENEYEDKKEYDYEYSSVCMREWMGVNEWNEMKYKKCMLNNVLNQKSTIEITRISFKTF